MQVETERDRSPLRCGAVRWRGRYAQDLRWPAHRPQRRLPCFWFRQAHYGKDNENGARMAIEDLNKQNVTIGGKKAKFELVAEELTRPIRSKVPPPPTKLSATRRSQSASSASLNSGTTIPASKIYNACGMPEITPSATNPALTKQGFNNVFRRSSPRRQRARLGPRAVRVGRAQAQAHRRHRRPHRLCSQGVAEVVQEGGWRRAASRSSASSTRTTRRPTSCFDPDGHQVEEPGRDLLRRHGPAGRPDAAPARLARPDERQVLRRRRHLHREADGTRCRREVARQRGVRAGRRLDREDARRPGMEEALRREVPGRIPAICSPYTYDATMTLVDA